RTYGPTMTTRKKSRTPSPVRVKRSEILSFRHGERVGNYTILTKPGSTESGTAEPLGSGGSGVVYLAQQKLLEGVAVKRAIKFFVYDDRIRQLTIHERSGPIS